MGKRSVDQDAQLVRARAVVAGREAAAELEHASETDKVRLRRIVSAGEHARAEMVASNLGLVGFFAARHRGFLDDDELEAAGIEGLLKAVDKFDPERGFLFSTYAQWWIRQSMQRANDRHRRHMHVVSLDASVGDEQNSRTLQDIVASDADVEHEALESLETYDAQARLEANLATLPGVASFIVQVRLGLEPGSKAVGQIAARAKLTAAATSEWEAVGLSMLRHPSGPGPVSYDKTNEKWLRTKSWRAPVVLELSFQDPFLDSGEKKGSEKVVGGLHSSYAHGSRARYVFGPDEYDNLGGCRCEECRRANREYAKQREQRLARGEGLLPSDSVRAHLLWLANHGVGMRSVAAASGVERKTIVDLRDQKSTRCTQRVAKALLKVGIDAAADGARIDAAETWRNIEILLAAGWTKGAISREIGQNGRTLQLGKQYVCVRHARTIAEIVQNLSTYTKEEAL